MDYIKRLPQKLLQLRKASGLSQQNIADYLRISKAYYCRIESGERTVQNSQLQLLAKLFNTDILYLRSLFLADSILETISTYSNAEINSALKILTTE